MRQTVTDYIEIQRGNNNTQKQKGVCPLAGHMAKYVDGFMTVKNLTTGKRLLDGIESVPPPT